MCTFLAIWDSVLGHHLNMLNDCSPWGRCLAQAHRDGLDRLCAIPLLGNEDTKRITNTLHSDMWNPWLSRFSSWAGGSVQIWAVQCGSSHPRQPLSSWYGLIWTERGLGVTHTLDSPSVLRFSHVGCKDIYNCFIFFVDRSFGHYVVSFLVSYSNLKVYFVLISIAPLTFSWFSFVRNVFFHPLTFSLCVFRVKVSALYRMCMVCFFIHFGWSLSILTYSLKCS